MFISSAQSGRVRVNWLIASVALATLVRAQAPGDARAVPRVEVRVQGTVYDSLTRTPLAFATVQFASESEPLLRAAARTDAAGKFELGLSAGRWHTSIIHARFDSLGVTLPLRSIEVPPVSRFWLSLATPSSRTLVRAYCGRHLADSSGVLVGTIRNARSPGVLDSARAVALWSDLLIRAGRLRLERPVIGALTNRNGWFVLCGVPAGSEVLVWAERGAASSGGVEVPIAAYGLARMDLALDPEATMITRASVDSLAGPAGVVDRRPKPRTGAERVRAVIVNAAGKPLLQARARIEGHRPASVDEAGVAILDSLPAGTQTLTALALGFAPASRAIDVEVGGLNADTVVMESLKTLLDTVRVTARTMYDADVNGFERRRKSGWGDHFFTREEIERTRPFEFTSLLVGLAGFTVSDISGAGVRILIRDGLGFCEPAIFLDGIYQSKWLAEEVNEFARPDEIEGVEVYRRASETPPEYQSPGYGDCGSIVIWTRWRRPRVKVPRP